jgi:hypothetical protein
MRALVLIGLVTFASGCSNSAAAPADAGSTSHSDAGDASLGDGAATGAAAFVGTWARSGEFAITCPGKPESDEAITGDLLIALGGGSDSIVATQPDGCTLTYVVSGSVASAAAGQPCNSTIEGGTGSITTTVTHTLTLSSDGSSLAEASSDTVAFSLGDGGSLDCTATSTGTFTRPGAGGSDASTGD